MTVLLYNYLLMVIKKLMKRMMMKMKITMEVVAALKDW